MPELLVERSLPGGALLQVALGDITDEATDAIVNAANSALQLGGGVAGAILRRGGGAIQRECDAIGYTPTGGAAVTSGGALPARRVIHAVGPVWKGGGEGEEALLASALRRSLEIAEEEGLRSIALPAVSSGIFGFPKRRCVEIILSAIRTHFDRQPRSLRLVRCVSIDRATAEAFGDACRALPL